MYLFLHKERFKENWHRERFFLRPRGNFCRNLSLWWKCFNQKPTKTVTVEYDFYSNRHGKLKGLFSLTNALSTTAFCQRQNTAQNNIAVNDGPCDFAKDGSWQNPFLNVSVFTSGAFQGKLTYRTFFLPPGDIFSRSVSCEINVKMSPPTRDISPICHPPHPATPVAWHTLQSEWWLNLFWGSNKIWEIRSLIWFLELRGCELRKTLRWKYIPNMFDLKADDDKSMWQNWRHAKSMLLVIKTESIQFEINLLFVVFKILKRTYVTRFVFFIACRKRSNTQNPSILCGDVTADASYILHTIQISLFLEIQLNISFRIKLSYF